MNQPKFNEMTEVYINYKTEAEREFIDDYYNYGDKIMIGYPRYNDEYNQYMYLVSGRGSILESSCSVTKPKYLIRCE